MDRLRSPGSPGSRPDRDQAPRRHRLHRTWPSVAIVSIVSVVAIVVVTIVVSFVATTPAAWLAKASSMASLASLTSSATSAAISGIRVSTPDTSIPISAPSSSSVTSDGDLLSHLQLGMEPIWVISAPVGVNTADPWRTAIMASNSTGGDLLQLTQHQSSAADFAGYARPGFRLS